MYTTIFDLDETLCRVNTSYQFGLYLTKIGILPLHKLPLLAGCYILYKWNFLSMHAMHTFACRHIFSQKSIIDIQKHVKGFLDRKLESMLDRAVFNLFDSFKKQGYYTVLLSSSPDFLVQEIASRLDFDDWAATKYTLTSLHTIDAIGQLMEGESKARYVEELIATKKVSRDKIIAYSDSFLDIPLLSAVGNPVAVNPDKKLKRFALQSGWEVMKTKSEV